MAEFSRLVITNKGQALLAKMMTGEGNVEFTKTSTSDMEYTLEQLEALTEFSGVKQTVSVAKVTRTNGVAVTIEAIFNNLELTEGYHMRALGLYAIDPDDGEILYAVTAEMSGCCYMPAYNGVTVSGACIKLVTTVGNAENVSLEVDPGVYATVGEIKELRECVDGIETWKDNTQKRLDNWGPTIVGHGQVINSLRDSIGNLKPVATSGSYNDLNNKPDLKMVATTGNYNDLTNKPVIPAAVRVKGNAESSYRTGDINLTAANIGAINKAGDTVIGVLNFNDGGIKIANKTLKDYIATMTSNSRWAETRRSSSGWTQHEGYTYVDFANGTRILTMEILTEPVYSIFFTQNSPNTTRYRIQFPVNFWNAGYFAMIMFDSDKIEYNPRNFHIHGRSIGSVNVDIHQTNHSKNTEYLVESIRFFAIGRWK